MECEFVYNQANLIVYQDRQLINILSLSLLILDLQKKLFVILKIRWIKIVFIFLEYEYIFIDYCYLKLGFK